MICRLLPCSAVLLMLVLAGPAQAASRKAPAPSPPRTSLPADVAPRRPAPVEAFVFEGIDGPPAISAASAIVVDAYTGRVLHELNAAQRRPVASTQKLLTALLVAESGGLDQSVRVAASDTWCEPSMLHIKPGESYSRGALLRILLVKSMNDVARCLARDNAGSVEAFANRMNAKARSLGMSDSNFLNPNGLPAPGQFSTARDMARLALVAYQNQIIRPLVRTQDVSWRYNDGRVKKFTNTNRVLKSYPLCDGMKTGYTEASGFCLISSASNGGRAVIAVVLGDTRERIWTDSHQLLAWALSS